MVFRCIDFTRIVYIAAALTIGLPSARAATTWDTAGSGDKLNWSDANNWNPVGVPGDGAEVVITNGSVLLTNETAALSSLTITNATLTFSNWMTRAIATNVTIQNMGTFTHVTNSATTTNADGSWPTNGRVWIVCTNLDLQVGGQINAKWRGYRGGDAFTNGYGPGRGAGGNSLDYRSYGNGGSYGGQGGVSARPCFASYPYGMTHAPEMPGSGGGGYNGNGHGGGAVRIEADTVAINGAISADGKDYSSNGGGGSGGAIFISCRTFSGTTNGYLTARGGRGLGTGSGGGGGGRIAVSYDPAAQSEQATQPAVRFNVAGGYMSLNDGANGTLYLPDAALLTPDLAGFERVRIYGVTNWSVDHLSMTNGVTTNNIAFSESRFVLKVTNTLLVDSATLQVGSGLAGTEDAPEYTQIACGDIQLTAQGTNASRLYVYSGPTNAMTTNYGAYVTVANNITLASNCWIYPVSCGTNGGSVFFSAANVTIDAGGGFNANGLGYEPGNTSVVGAKGYGPGGGAGDSSGNGQGGGGGYGGKGGAARAAGGIACGYTNAPTWPGSGGGGGLVGYASKPGGGLVWIKVSGTMTLNGILQANGTSGSGNYRAAGSGGGILVIAGKKFRAGPNASLSAAGGNQDGISGAQAGAGGGGRIAIWHHISESEQQTILADPNNAAANVPRIVFTNDLAAAGFGGSYSVTNGTGVTFGNTAQPGSFIIVTVPPPKGMIFSVR
ncbi:MAG: hypothetical protein PHW60_15480 [Kiritimatiellae bacterium]|nr:hypothetical protein [Kiritimatiellia bacterium]